MTSTRDHSRRFAGKVCVITGAGQGIGRATARRIAEEGGQVILVDRVIEAAARVRDELMARRIIAEPMIADLTDLGQVRGLMTKVRDGFGRIDVLCNVVGGTIWWQPYHHYTEDQIRAELDRSLFTVLWCCLAALPVMVEQRSGVIVNLSSMVVRGKLYRAPYAVSKGGVEALTKSLAVEYGPYGIRINAVAPGSTTVDDRMTSRMVLGEGRIAASNSNQDRYIEEGRVDPAGLALRRSSTVDEQAAAIAFAASDDASYITGQVINCFGEP